jgi:putative FmdB family regulatory protein
MPIYEYKCNECEHTFDDYLNVSDRDKPLKEPCPECGENSVTKLVSATTMGVDMNCTPDKKTGGDWSRLMDRMKKNTVPKRYHDNIDRATNRSGGKIGPQ